MSYTHPNFPCSRVKPKRIKKGMYFFIDSFKNYKLII